MTVIGIIVAIGTIIICIAVVFTFLLMGISMILDSLRIDAEDIINYIRRKE